MKKAEILGRGLSALVFMTGGVSAPSLNNIPAKTVTTQCMKVTLPNKLPELFFCFKGLFLDAVVEIQKYPGGEEISIPGREPDFEQTTQGTTDLVFPYSPDCVIGDAITNGQNTVSETCFDVQASSRRSRSV